MVAFYTWILLVNSQISFSINQLVGPLCVLFFQNLFITSNLFTNAIICKHHINTTQQHTFLYYTHSKQIYTTICFLSHKHVWDKFFTYLFFFNFSSKNSLRSDVSVILITGKRLENSQQLWTLLTKTEFSLMDQKQSLEFQDKLWTLKTSISQILL